MTKRRSLTLDTLKMNKSLQKLNSFNLRINLIRSLHSSRIALAESPETRAVREDSDQSSSESTKTDRQKKRLDVLFYGQKWLQTAEATKFNSMDARNWMHPSRPFPRNPWFVPPSPVADQTRSQIYAEYCSDPYKWTPRQLALRYNLSVLRVEAILRLKHLERNQVEKKTFTKAMERTLDADGPERVVEDVDLRTRLDTVLRPVYALRDDALVKEKSDPVDYTDELQYKRRPDGNYVMPLSGVVTRPSDEKTVIEKENPREVNRRWKWLIADTSADVELSLRNMYVRENDGTLRTAAERERKMHLKLFPQEPTNELLNKSTTAELWEV